VNISVTEGFSEGGVDKIRRYKAKKERKERGNKTRDVEAEEKTRKPAGG
jgi:hypothetical protein